MTPRQFATAVAVTVSAAGTATVAGLDANRPESHALVTRDAGAMSECVIPDCRRVTGRLGWDPSHEAVDCLAVGPYSQTGRPVWRGCSVLRREYSTGSQCLPAKCAVIAGEDPLSEVP